MMYHQKLVAAVKVAGKVLREQGESVYLPFGSEYSIFLRNMENLRALISIEIDGQKATEGVQLILPANGTLELERFIKNANMDQGNRFKFIERTAAIENGPRGIKAEDGLVRIEFDFERPPIQSLYDGYHGARAIGSPGGISGSILRGASGSPYNGTADWGKLQSAKAEFASYDWYDVSMQAKVEATNTAGITAPGSVSEQKFNYGSWFPTQGVKHVMVLKLLGEHKGVEVVKAVTVKTKLKCVTCGHVNKASSKFCTQCGTGLNIV